MHTDINSEDRLVQETFAGYLRDELGWESAYAWNDETFGSAGNLGRDSERDAVLKRDLRQGLARLNPNLPEVARAEAFQKLTQVDYARSLLQHNQQFYKFIQGGVPVSWRDAGGDTRYDHARVIDFRSAANNRFVAVREMKFQGLRVPHYNRRADIVCIVNGLPLAFIELKAVYRNIRQGFDNNLTDYLTEQVIPHVFHHNAFLVVSNGDRAKFGSISSKWEHFAEWKRNDEKQKSDLAAMVLLDGMLARDRLLDIVENFILFDESRPGGTRKIIARNHQVLGVNNAVASVMHQEELKSQYPPERRLIEYRIPREPPLLAAERGPEDVQYAVAAADIVHGEPGELEFVPLVKRAHPDLGRLGVFWHTQGSGKSYSMAFFVQKVRRVVRGNFTFVLMTDREDLDDQIFRTFVGCGVADEQTPRAASGKMLKALLQENHRLVFSLVHKFNQDVKPGEPYSKRDDIIVISDEAHRTQSGKMARNMRLALPNAAFIGFTGTPLFKHDQLTQRIFGTYVSRYDFKRSEEDNSTVKLIYENRGEKLGMARLEQALAQYALGDDDDAGQPRDIVAPIETLVAALVDGLEAVEKHLHELGFDAARLRGAKGFEKIAALKDAVDALYTSDEAKRRFEIMAREVFARFKALLMEPSAFTYAERHDNIEAIYKKLEERRDTADVTEVLKELHRIVNEAIRAAAPGDDHAEGLCVDLSQIDFERLRKEFAKAPRKNLALRDMREVVENKLARMLQNNPALMDYYRRYQEIIADYNREKDRVTVEQTFAALLTLAGSLDQEQHRAVQEGLTAKELALFDLLYRENISRTEREQLKQASKSLLGKLQQLLAPMGHWTRNAQTQAEVQASILAWLFETLPRPPFTEPDTQSLADRIYEHVWQQSEAGNLGGVS